MSIHPLLGGRPANDTFFRGSRAETDPVIREMLNSGVVNPPSPDDDESAPRAVG